MKALQDLTFLEQWYRGMVHADDARAWVQRWLSADDVSVRDHQSRLYLPLHVYLGLTWTEHQRWERTGQLPTEAQHHRVGNVDHVAVTGGRLIVVHGPQSCAPPCPVHAPSDHPLRDAKKSWRDDTRILERVCRHGYGHPDPDDRRVRREGWPGIHTCCEGRCCDRSDGLSPTDSESARVAPPARESDV